LIISICLVLIHCYR